MTRKLILKVILIIAMVVIVQYLYYQVLGAVIPSIQKTSRMDFRFENESKDDFNLAFIASSINFTTAKSDKDKRDMAQMVDDALEECHVLDVSRGGNNVELYDEITAAVLKKKATGVKFIFEISVRTFAPVYNEPDNARSLKDDEVIFRDDLLTAFYHALNVFRFDFGIDSKEDYNSMDIYKGSTLVGPLDEFMENDHPSNLTSPQKKFLINYMGRIDNHNPKLIALRKLVSIIRKQELDVLFLIPPENYRQGIKLFPNEFEKEFDANISIVTRLLDKEGMPYLNLSKSLGSKRFTHTPLYPNGHLDQRGRQFVANKITDQISCPSSD